LHIEQKKILRKMSSLIIPINKIFTNKLLGI
jgi:hypothetical protein